MGHPYVEENVYILDAATKGGFYHYNEKIPVSVLFGPVASLVADTPRILVPFIGALGVAPLAESIQGQ